VLLVRIPPHLQFYSECRTDRRGSGSKRAAGVASNLGLFGSSGLFTTTWNHIPQRAAALAAAAFVTGWDTQLLALGYSSGSTGHPTMPKVTGGSRTMLLRRVDRKDQNLKFSVYYDLGPVTVD